MINELCIVYGSLAICGLVTGLVKGFQILNSRKRIVWKSFKVLLVHSHYYENYTRNYTAAIEINPFNRALGENNMMFQISNSLKN